MPRPCDKWVAPLTDCETVPESCPNSALTYVQQDLRTERIYYDTPEGACEGWHTWGYPNDTHEVHETMVGTDGVRCWSDSDDPEGLDDEEDDTDTVTVIYLDTFELDSCCAEEENIVGPHSTITPDVWYYPHPGPSQPQLPDAGRPFTTLDRVILGQGTKPAQIRRVREENLVSAPDLFYSDLVRPGVPTSISEVETEICEDGILSKAANADPDCAPEVDHIIPRVDSHGCPCGSNSFNNVQLISHAVNNELSNNCNDPLRRDMIDYYSGL